ncbi:DUF429 domain-containing protein [Desulfosoma caldarium]|uniref:Uncharacterized protein DUF429 n=1 Tax=Desulfosoma caldarium TaxID=610254 RepID=A0A3N1UI11_9BACT|nr:DUF429 domain-containing protein [Desulfosoma caldarium]ROQ90895.1 uncharacterized protein DUF429 [Desulfosoma caldarium]
MKLYGIDFTSAPRRAKPITVAAGCLVDNRLLVEQLERLTDWSAFETFLRRPGPWLGGFDFPFGLPREAVIDLGWPSESWAAMVAHCHALGKTAFRATLDAYRQSRPFGRRYAHRATDIAARSHSPLKLVNPPVGLMFLEGAPRLLAAGVHLPGLHTGDVTRVALEAYPGLLARRLGASSYKNDTRRLQNHARQQARCEIVTRLQQGSPFTPFRLHGTQEVLTELIRDASGDALDAVLALVQAAQAWRSGPPSFGLPATFDPLEGWIIGAEHGA